MSTAGKFTILTFPLGRPYGTIRVMSTTENMVADERKKLALSRGGWGLSVVGGVYLECMGLIQSGQGLTGVVGISGVSKA